MFNRLRPKTEEEIQSALAAMNDDQLFTAWVLMYGMEYIIFVELKKRKTPAAKDYVERIKRIVKKLEYNNHISSALFYQIGKDLK